MTQVRRWVQQHGALIRQAEQAGVQALLEGERPSFWQAHLAPLPPGTSAPRGLGVPWQTVYGLKVKWNKRGVWEVALDALNRLHRKKSQGSHTELRDH